MYEVEVKVPVSLDAVRGRLADVGADHRETVSQLDTYYDAPHRDLGTSDEALRVRTERRNESTRTLLTYKGPLADNRSKSRREIETVVEEESALTTLLEELGFEPVATVEKDRERYRLDGYTVALDCVRDLGEFVEVETEASNIDPARDGAMAILERLDIDPRDRIRTSYLSLLLDDNHQ